MTTGGQSSVLQSSFPGQTSSLSPAAKAVLERQPRPTMAESQLYLRVKCVSITGQQVANNYPVLAMLFLTWAAMMGLVDNENNCNIDIMQINGIILEKSLCNERLE